MSKKNKTPYKVIRKLIRDGVWFGRDDKLHGVSATADIIEREVVELAYQEGFANAQDPGEGYVMARIVTKHPDNYLLINMRDGTFWGLNKRGRWIAVTVIKFTNEETGKTEEFDLASLVGAKIVQEPIDDDQMAVADAMREEKSA
jgi:hypothetical protein